MRIQLAPWKVAETSLKVEAPEKSRSRTGDSATSLVSTSPLPLAACFAHSQLGEGPSKKKPKRSKQQSHVRIKDWQPALVVTIGHQIAVFGNDRKGLVDQTFEVKENADFLYQSRPDKPSEFIPSSQSKRAIPALIDDLHDRIYALQGDNGKLVSWSASTGGPDLNAVAVKLQSAAVSLSYVTLPVGLTLVYGTCADHSLFVGRITVDDTKAEAWSIEYFPAANDKMGPAGGGRHIHTRIKIDSADRLLNVSGTKRKIEATADSSDTLSIYQVFRNGTASGLYMIKRQISVSRAVQIRGNHTSKHGDDARIQVVSIPLSKKGTVKDALSTGVPSDSLLDLVYTVVATKEPDATSLFHISIDLENGCTFGPAFQIPSDVNQLNTVGRNYVVAASGSNIIVYDRKRGAEIHKSELDLLDLNGRFALIGDDRSERLAVVTVKGDELRVATSSLISDVTSQVRSPLTLAQSLVASMESHSATKTCISSCIFDLEKPWCKPFDMNKALTNVDCILRTTLNDLRCGRKITKQKISLTDAFEKALDSLEARKIQDAGQKDLVVSDKCSNGLLNGVHSNGKSKPINGQTNHLNGSLLPGAPASPGRQIPLVLAEMATSVCVDLLTLKGSVVPSAVHVDARGLLVRLIKTGNLSARRSLPPAVFVELLRAVDSVEGAESLQDIIFQTLQHVSDVSEYHMVCMLQLIIRKAQKAGERSSKTSPLRIVLQLLDRLVNYSDINDALLRSAAKELLTQDDSCLVMRLLAALLGTLSHKVSRLRSMHWIGVLSELVRGGQTPAGNHISAARQIVSNEVKKIESMIAVKRLVDRRLFALSTCVQDDGLPQPAMPNQQPPYQIERLVF